MMEWEQQEALNERRPLSPLQRMLIVNVQRAATWAARHWLFIINGFWGLLLFGSLLPPTLMALGLEGPGKVTYAIYSFTCHQLPERSYFLFGPQGVVTTYGKEEVVAAGADDSNLLTLRQYVGSPEMGWKLGFSDRMVSMYGGAFLAGILFWLGSRRGRMKPIPIVLMLLMIAPMALDGTSHMISEISTLGFRESNAWAMPLFGAQSPEFYAGTEFGSLNSILRLVTGLLFGTGMMLFAYPLIGYSFDDLSAEAEETLARNQARMAAMKAGQ
ncbi:MAG: DUF2085 domain-containing protein [Ardenticatenales bacterium]|nr:DUF2085 domain-containing protein [Ardenticatenales bacterium]